jgi:SAM-dependent methyltransferase
MNQLINQLLYRGMYRLGQSHWDTGETPPEVIEAIKAADFPSGPGLDLGCGTGTHVVYMARQGRQAIGVDFVPAAIAKAREKARQAGVADLAQFTVGDVTRLPALNLPKCGFALDMGCFHGLNADDQRRYVAGLASLLLPGGLCLLYAVKPRREVGVAFGMLPEQVQAAFAPAFELQRMKTGGPWEQGSTWFWLRRRAS